MKKIMEVTGIALMMLASCSVHKSAHDMQPKTYDSTSECQEHQTPKQERMKMTTSPPVPEPITQQKPAECKKRSSMADETLCLKRTKPIATKLKKSCKRMMGTTRQSSGYAMPAPCVQAPPYPGNHTFNTEQYASISENSFKQVADDPLSTFSIDVDAASYSNIRRFLNSNTLPPKVAVRIEEMINYFTYDYPDPKKQHPFSITAEVGDCPWAENNKLIHIGLQGKKIATGSLPSSNLVFLLDVSGSMNSSDKLPLLKTALTLLVDQLRPQDRVAIVVYAGSAGLVLPSTPGTQKQLIADALDRLQAGGSTAGGAGIQLAYKTAKEYFIEEGNNRVILATDGDFNVGVSSDGALVRMIEEKRNAGIFLTILGFGTGNYKDVKMEQLADKGNGNYAYIDNVLEAKKVLVNEMSGTLVTIAKDVKIQIEFNPEHVAAYRLVGYENRILAHQDFNDDTKDAGELGSGHTVTALYEIIPTGSSNRSPSVDPLKYQQPRKVKKVRKYSNELCTVKFRYKKPDGHKSQLIQQSIEYSRHNSRSDNFKFSSAVAGFGMLLRDSPHKGNLTYNDIIELARTSRGADSNGYRSECIKMMEQAEILSVQSASIQSYR